jgi:hypothetical protein
MQWQTTIMITWVQWHTGGAMQWYLIKHTNNSLALVIFITRKNLMNVNLYIAMPWIKNLATLISTISMRLHVTIPMVARPVPATPFGCPTFLIWYTYFVFVMYFVCIVRLKIDFIYLSVQLRIIMSLFLWIRGLRPKTKNMYYNKGILVKKHILPYK